MTKIGSILIVTAIVLWFFNPLAWIFADSSIGAVYIFIPIIIGILGVFLTFFGVLKDRIQEHKEEVENDDYRKY